MTKSSSALLSLVAAVPGGFLAFLLVMAFLNHADKMGGTLNAVVGVALLCGVTAALMPVGLLVFGGPKGPKKPKAPKPKKQQKAKKGKPVDEPSGEQAVVDESEDREGASDEALETEESGELSHEFDADEFVDELETDESAAELEVEDEGSDEWDVPETDASDEFEFDDALSDDEMEFDFDEEEEK